MTKETELIIKLREQGVEYPQIQKMLKAQYDKELAVASIRSRYMRAKKKEMVQKTEVEVKGTEILKELEQRAGGLFKIGVLDCETTALVADFGYLLVSVIRNIETGTYDICRLDETPSYKVLENHRKVEFWRRVDREVLERIRAAYENYDIILHYNGRWFDIRFLNTRLIKNELPVLPDMKQVDIYQIARYKLKLASRKLDALKEFLEIDTETTGHQWEYWQMAANGVKEGFDFVVDHCIRDVDRITEAARKIKPLINYIKK